MGTKAIRIIIVGVVILVLLAAGYRFYSEQTFNEFLEKVESNNKSELDIILEGEVLGNENLSTLSQINWDDLDKNAVIAGAAKLKNDNKKYLDLDEKSGKLILETANESKQIQNKKLWLSKKQKQFLQKIDEPLQLEAESVNKTKEISKIDYSLLNQFATWFEDLALLVEAGSLSENQLQDASSILRRIDSFKKYASKSYTFPDEESIKVHYPNSYAIFKSSIELFGNYHRMYEALYDQDSELAITLAEEVERQSNLFTSDERTNKFLEEFGRQDPDSAKRQIETVSKYVDAFEYYHKEKVYEGIFEKKPILIGKNRNVAEIASTAIGLYKIDNEESIPEVSNFEDLWEKLVEKRYINNQQNLNFDPSKFTYTYEDSSYTLSYEEETNHSIIRRKLQSTKEESQK